MQHASLILGGWLALTALLLCACGGDKHDLSEESALGDAPGAYTIANGKLPVTIPFEFYDMNILIHASMNGADFAMLIDNGVMWDELWFYSSDTADSLSFDYGGGGVITGAGEGDGVESYDASGLTITIGDVTFSDQTALVSDASQRFGEMFPGVAGQICGTLFKHFVVEFNFDDMTIILHDPATYTYTGDGAAIPMTRDNVGSYSIPLQVKTAEGRLVDLDCDIDLGGIYGLNLPLDESAGLTSAGGKPLENMYGASGPIHGFETTMPAVRIGEYDMPDVLTALIDAEQGDVAQYTVGLPVFKRFNLVFDYFHNILYVEPNQHFATPFSEDER